MATDKAAQEVRNAHKREMAAHELADKIRQQLLEEFKSSNAEVERQLFEEREKFRQKDIDREVRIGVLFSKTARLNLIVILHPFLVCLIVVFFVVVCVVVSCSFCCGSLYCDAIHRFDSSFYFSSLFFAS